jgi:spoIIIJ-associated protein
MELVPMPAWQRRIVHLAIEKTPGVKSESIGEEPERRLVITTDSEKAA